MPRVLQSTPECHILGGRGVFGVGAFRGNGVLQSAPECHIGGGGVLGEGEGEGERRVLGVLWAFHTLL